MKSVIFGSLSALVLVASGLLTQGAQAQVFSSQRAPNSQTPNSQTPTAQNDPTQVAQSRTAVQTRLEREETLYLSAEESYAYDLIVQTASTLNGTRLPVGAVIRGRFEPTEGGLFYVAESVELADRIFSISATSELIRARKDPRETSTGAILTDAAIGAAGGYVLGEVFGEPDLWEVAGGAAAGVLIGNTTAPFVVVISSNDPVVLYSAN